MGGAADGPPASREPGELALGFARLPGWRGELLFLLGFLVAACVLTWPLVATLGKASGMRGDYFDNLWNAWWVKHSIREGHSPYWTDYLYFPEGISLRRHTLSPVNSLTLALFTTVLDGHQAFNVLLLLHLALSAWCFSLLARYVTGCTTGSLLAGLVYSFCPFHYFYLCQINVFSFEFLPLALLFFMKHQRDGGGRNLAGVALALGGTVMSSEYYVVYAYLTMAILLACAGARSGGVPRALGWKRAALAGGTGALFVVLLSLPLLYATLGPEKGMESGTAAFSVEKHRTNDLLGFYWIGPKEESIVSWPTMLGYSTLALVLIGARGLARLWPWLLVGALFFVLSLGETLEIGGKDTGVPMPHALFGHLPVLSMLRKSDRAFMMVQLVVALALAGSWSAIAARWKRPAVRAGLACAAGAVLAFELGAAPLERFQPREPAYLRELAADPSVTSVMELPAARTHVGNGRFVFLQTLHEKKSTLGYTTALAVTPFHDQRLVDLVNEYWQFVFGINRALAERAAAAGIDRIVHYKTFPMARDTDFSIEGKTIWSPFRAVHAPLVRVRQLGEFQDLDLDSTVGEVVARAVPELASRIAPAMSARPFSEVARAQFTRVFGPPVHEDGDLMVFAVRHER